MNLPFWLKDASFHVKEWHSDGQQVFKRKIQFLGLKESSAGGNPNILFMG